MRPCSSRMSRESRSFGIVETSVRVHVDSRTSRRVLAHKQDGVVPESDTCRDAPRGRRMPTQRGADGACPVARSGGSHGALPRRRFGEAWLDSSLQFSSSRPTSDPTSKGLRRKPATRQHADRPIRTVAGHDPILNLKAVLAKPLSPYLRRRSPVPHRGIARTSTGRNDTRPHARLMDQRGSPAAFSSAVIFSTACSTSEGLRAPVQTSFPLPNRRTTTFGSSMRYTRPGNCSGSYSTFSRPRKSLEIQLCREGGRGDDVLDFELGQGNTSDRPEAWVPARLARTGFE